MNQRFLINVTEQKALQGDKAFQNKYLILRMLSSHGTFQYLPALSDLWHYDSIYHGHCHIQRRLSEPAYLAERTTIFTQTGKTILIIR